MAVVVKVHTKGLDKLQRLVDVLPKNMDVEIPDANQAYAELVEESLKKQLMFTSERFNWKIYRGILAQRLSKFTSIVKMPIEGTYLDSMSPHWVSLKPGRLITQWAEERGFKGKSVFVTAHPFIDAGLRRVRKRLTPELREGVRKAFRRSRQ